MTTEHWQVECLPGAEHPSREDIGSQIYQRMTCANYPLYPSAWFGCYVSFEKYKAPKHDGVDAAFHDNDPGI